MSTCRFIAPAIAMALAASLSAPAADKPAPRQPATKAARVPPAELAGLRGLYSVNRRLPREKARRLLLEQMDRLIERGRRLEAEYPNASNLHEVRKHMLRAAGILLSARKDSDSRRRMLRLAEALTNDANAPIQVRVYADRLATAEKVQPSGQAVAGNAGKLLRDYVKRYAGSPAEAMALMNAARMAGKIKLDKLADEFIAAIEKDHADAPGMCRFLVSVGRGPVFKAELTKLDGANLSLPKDLAGKVVVIDFWATWCGPCRASLPHMKQVYAKYKDKGVEFVGISLDRPDGRNQLKAFVKQNGINWVHTYSGKGWRDPTARRCGIEGIPSIWVIGKDGRVVSTTARGDLAGTIDKALRPDR